MITDLSRPSGKSVNVGIDIADFPLYFCGVDDAVKLLSAAGESAFMAKLMCNTHSNLCLCALKTGICSDTSAEVSILSILCYHSKVDLLRTFSV